MLAIADRTFRVSRVEPTFDRACKAGSGSIILRPVLARRSSPVLALAACALASACEARLADPQSTSAPSIDPDTDAPEPRRPDTPSEPPDCASTPLDPGSTLVRRLAPWEYARVVQSTFGLELRADIEAAWPPRARVHGLSNAAEAQVVTLTHVQAFEALARDVAARVDASALLEQCAGLADTECPLRLAQALGRQLFRRELSMTDAVPWADLMSAASEREDGVRRLVSGMLQSGSFLYRIEREADGEDVVPVSPEDLASRLAFLVWGDGPDAALRRAAVEGRLTSEDDIRREVRRLLADPRAQAHSLELVTDWFGIASVGRSNVADAYPEVDAELLEAMKAEALALARRVFWTDAAPLGELFTSRRAVLGPRLARWYGLEPVSDVPAEYELPAPRAGLLTQGALLAQSGGAEASMITRGLYLLDTVLCQELPPPPESLDISDDGSAEASTEREASEIRLSRPVCAGCHESMEPLAHALEPFDGAGRFRTEDGEGDRLRGDGAMTLQSGESLRWSDAADFARKLVATEAVQRCLVEKPLAFALGRRVDDEGSDACVVEEIRGEYTQRGGTYAALIEAIAAHPVFRTMRPIDLDGSES